MKKNIENGCTTTTSVEIIKFRFANAYFVAQNNNGAKLCKGINTYYNKMVAEIKSNIEKGIEMDFDNYSEFKNLIVDYLAKEYGIDFAESFELYETEYGYDNSADYDLCSTLQDLLEMIYRGVLNGHAKFRDEMPELQLVEYYKLPKFEKAYVTRNIGFNCCEKPYKWHNSKYYVKNDQFEIIAEEVWDEEVEEEVADKPTDVAEEVTEQEEEVAEEQAPESTDVEVIAIKGTDKYLMPIANGEEVCDNLNRIVNDYIKSLNVEDLKKPKDINELTAEIAVKYVYEFAFNNENYKEHENAMPNIAKIMLAFRSIAEIEVEIGSTLKNENVNIEVFEFFRLPKAEDKYMKKYFGEKLENNYFDCSKNFFKLIDIFKDMYKDNFLEEGGKFRTEEEQVRSTDTIIADLKDSLAEGEMMTYDEFELPDGRNKEIVMKYLNYDMEHTFYGNFKLDQHKKELLVELMKSFANDVNKYSLNRDFEHYKPFSETAENFVSVSEFTKNGDDFSDNDNVLFEQHYSINNIF